MQLLEKRKNYITERKPYMADRCICCGEIIPEGRQVCLSCEEEISKPNQPHKEIASHKGLLYHLEYLLTSRKERLWSKQ